MTGIETSHSRQELERDQRGRIVVLVLLVVFGVALVSVLAVVFLVGSVGLRNVIESTCDAVPGASSRGARWLPIPHAVCLGGVPRRVLLRDFGFTWYVLMAYVPTVVVLGIILLVFRRVRRVWRVFRTTSDELREA